MVRAINSFDDRETKVRRRWAREGSERDEYVAEYRVLVDIRRSVVIVIASRHRVVRREACLTTKGRFYLSTCVCPRNIDVVLPPAVYELVNFENSAAPVFISLLNLFYFCLRLTAFVLVHSHSQ